MHNVKKSFFAYRMLFFEKPSEHQFRKTMRDIVLLVLILLAFRAFSYQHYLIPSGSMIPTLNVGDFVMVNKASYGYSRYSLPWHVPLIKGKILMTQTPKMGDVIAFVNPKNTKMDYIKRCVGLPGDTIKIRQGKLYINGNECQYKKIADYETIDFSGKQVEYHCYEETLPNGVTHVMMRTEDSQDALLTDPRNNTEEFVVPEDHYFAMGDNRNQSQDSRYPNPGFVPINYIWARGELICFSVDFSFKGNKCNPLTWYKFKIKPRWSHIGKRIS